MSVIIKATGVTFSNTNLPILSPMITDGLVGAFRPNSSPLGLLDLSGNGKTLTKQGNPTLTSNSIIVNKDNGFITDIPETMDVTLIAVHRAIKGNGENPWDGFVVGCFYGNRGTSIWNAYYAPASKITINAQCYGKKITNGEFLNRQWHFWDRATDDNTTHTDFIFSAFVVKATDNKMFVYLPKEQSTPVRAYDAVSDGYRLDARHLSDPATGLPNLYKLGLANVGFGNGKSEIVEVLIYNRALNQDEIIRQYLHSKEFMSKHRNIDI